MGPYNAGPKSTLFLRVALIKAGVFEKLSIFEIWHIAALACTLCFLTNFLTNIPIKSGIIDLFIFRGVIKVGVKGAVVKLGSALQGSIRYLESPE